jgi:hypothetical protein
MAGTDLKQSFIRTRYPDFPRYPAYLDTDDVALTQIWNDISRWAASLIRVIDEADTRSIFFVVEDQNKSIKIDGRIRVAEIGVSVTPAAGDMRYDTATNKHQGFNGTTWNNFY